MAEHEFIHKWTQDDVSRWSTQIRQRDLSFEDQVAIVQFIADQRQHYFDLHRKYAELFDLYQSVRAKVGLLAAPIEGLITLSRSDVDDEVLRAGLKFWTDQIMSDVLNRE